MIEGNREGARQRERETTINGIETQGRGVLVIGSTAGENTMQET